MVDYERKLIYPFRNSLGLQYFLGVLIHFFLNVCILFLDPLHLLFEGAPLLSETLAFLSGCLVLLGEICILLL